MEWGSTCVLIWDSDKTHMKYAYSYRHAIGLLKNNYMNILALIHMTQTNRDIIDFYSVYLKYKQAQYMEYIKPCYTR